MRQLLFGILTVGAASLIAPIPAHAVGTVSGPGSLEPVEQRVALSVGPDRVTLWSSTRVDAAGAIGIVAPAPVGAAVDWSSPAWMESLEVATAPRVFPPDGVTAVCPDDAEPHPFHAVGVLAHEPPLAPLDVAFLADAAAVTLWASQAGLTVSPGLVAGLAALEGPDMRFVAARFDAPGGEALTPTLRISTPAGQAWLPLVLTEAGTDELTVTAWLVAEGRAQLASAPEVLVDGQELVFDASTATSDYVEVRRDALLSGGTDATAVESASHESLRDNTAIAEGTHIIEGVITAYFERASSYGDALPDPATCISLGASSLASTVALAATCPRADLGVVDGVDDCVETVSPGQTDPATLRCGDGADDLALALSGMTPDTAWLTRHSLRIPAGLAGSVRWVDVPGGADVSPVVVAGSVDLTGCAEGGRGGEGGAPTGTGATGASVGSGGDPGTGAGGAGASLAQTQYVPVYLVDGGCSCSGTETIYVDSYETYDEDPPEAYYREEEDCGGDTETNAEESYDDDEGCSGDSSDSQVDPGGDGDGDGDWDGDGDTDETESFSDDEGCGSDSSESSSDDGGCGSDSSESSSDDGGCGSDTSDSGETTTAKRRRRPRLSVMTYGALVVLVPVRRLTRRRRRRRSDR